MSSALLYSTYRYEEFTMNKTFNLFLDIPYYRPLYNRFPSPFRPEAGLAVALGGLPSPPSAGIQPIVGSVGPVPTVAPQIRKEFPETWMFTNNIT